MTTVGIESPAGACTAVSATFSTTCNGTTTGDLILGSIVTVRFAVPGGATQDVVGTVTGPGPIIVAPPVVAAAPARAVAQPPLGAFPPPPVPPPPVMFGVPPPQLLPPPPQQPFGAPAPAPMPAPGIPVIPEANSLVLLGIGVAVLAGVALRRRVR